MKRTIALFLILLIVSLCFYSSFSLALPDSIKFQGLIEEVRIAGVENNIHPLVKSGETAQIDVLLTPKDVKPEEVSFTGMQFNSCQNVKIDDIDKSKCSLSLIPQSCTGLIQYKDVSQSIAFAIDSQRPSISSIQVIGANYFDGKPLIRNADFSVRYSGLGDSGECGGCAGVKELKIFYGGFADNKMIGKADFDVGSTSACVVPDSQVIISASNLASGLSEPGMIYAQACDTLDQCSQNIISAEVIVDTTKPVVNANIYDSNDEVINYFNPNMIYKIKAEITDEYGIDGNSLVIDLTQFGVSSPPLPVITEDEYTWTFQSSIQQPPTYFEITARDYAGNQQIFRKTLALVQDQSRPSLAGSNSVRTNHFYAGKSYIGKTNNTLQIEIADSGSGITRNGVIIDLSRLNAAYSSQEFPDSCELLANGNFLCEKYDIDSTIVEGVAEVKVTIMDRAGNILPEQSTNIYIDKIKPVISSITQNMPLPTSADEGSFGFIIDAIETNPIIVSADTSIFSDDGISQVICPSSTNCLLAPNDINPLSGDKSITIKVSDIAGNFVEKDYTFSLYQLAQCNVYGDGLVSMSAGSPNPSALDRRLASYKPFRIYVPLEMTHDPNIEVADIIVQYCENVPGITLGNYQIITGDTDNPFFLVSASVSTGTIPTEFPLACNFSLQLVHGDTKCINLEEEYFNFTIPLENFPLGDFGGEAQEKITGVEGRIQRLRNKIRDKEKKIEWIKNWCTLVEGMHYADSAAQAIKSILFGVGCVVSKLPYVGEAGKVIWQAGCYIGNIFGTLTSTLFWSKYYLPTDEQSVKEILGIGNKYLCIVYSCKLCNIGEIVKIGVGMAGDISRAGAGSDTSKLKDKGTEDKSQDRPAEPASPDSGRRDAMKEEDKWWEGVDEYEGAEAWTEAWEAEGEWVDEPAKETPSSPAVKYDFSKFQEGSHYFHYGDSANRGKTDFYQDMSEATDLGANYLDTDKYTWDPFKSVHYANACFCERGIIFNLKKERQIECIYRNCLKSHFEQGLPTTSCELAKQEQECLYIDSAEYKLYGYFNWEKLWQAAVKALAAYAYNQAFESLCGDYYKWKESKDRCSETKDEPCQGWQDAACGLAEAIVEVGELYTVYTQATELWQPPEIDEVYC